MTRWRGTVFALVAAALVCVVGLLGTVSGPASATSPPTVAIVGDSYTAGWTGTNPVTTGTPWYVYTAADLGWRVGHVVADPGAGFVQPGTYGTIPQALAAHPIDPATDFVLIQAGLNDANATDISGEPAAVAQTLQVVHQQAPNAVPIVVGAFDPEPYGATLGQLILVARRIGDYAALGPDTRYMIAFMCTYDVAADGTHPTAAGHHQIGDWIAWHVAHVHNGANLVWHPELGYWTT